MKTDLHGRRALVTGSTAGIGFAIAKGLAEAGAFVVVNGRAAEHVNSAIRRIRDAVPSAVLDGAVADAATAEGAAALIAAAPIIDILVNNLGIFELKPFFVLDDADWERMFETNVVSGVRLSRHYAPQMREAGWGRIIFISSESALNVVPDIVHYSASKAAQLAVSRGLANSLAGSGVTVNAVLPGPTRSEGMTQILEERARQSGDTIGEIEAAFIRTQRPTSLINRLIEPEEVASLVLYVASPKASAITGAALRVDGGVVNSII
jgi:NAD(P)-dependent dehydrogenase (short-subunit alcohol dehydrogenase family)